MAQGSSQNQVLTGNINSFNVSTNHHNTVNVNSDTDDERRQILEWLSPLDPRSRHQGVSSDRLEGVGDWLLETSEFREWRSGDDGSGKTILFCCGNPGVGKTYLSSLVIDSLCGKDGGKEVVVAGLYCDFVAQQEQSPTNMLGSILKQLVSGGKMPEHIRQAFQKAKKVLGGHCPRLPDLVKLLKMTIAFLPSVFICIDALDELLPKHRLELLGSLRDILQGSPSTRVLFTARPHVQDEIKEFFTEAVTIPISPSKDDIKAYLEMRLDKDTDPNAMDDYLRADILRIIPWSICEIFLLVSLNMDAILEEVTIEQRRRKLLEMTKGNGLGDAYSTTLARMKAQGRSRAKLGMEVLMWVSHAERPLKADELCYALGVERGSTDLNSRNIPAIQTLLGCTLGLVTVDSSSSTVRLFHLTLKEYLYHDPTLFHSPHLMMAEVCLTYLNFECFRNLPLAPREALRVAPFLEYASCYWGTKLRGEITESVKRLVLKLLDVYDKHVSSQFHFSHESDWRHHQWVEGSTTKGFTGLHCTAYFGLEELVVALLGMREWDLSATDAQGRTAIAWAVIKGHEEIVKLLLEQSGVNPDLADKEGRTPLLLAMEREDERIAMMLLERNDVNLDILDKEGREPLLWAASSGYEGVVKTLLKRNDVDPNTMYKGGRTPLLLAAERGHARVVKALLERNDVNPDTADEGGRTPLSWAAERGGYASIMVMLLRRNEVDPDRVDRQGQTPLSWAVKSGHGEFLMFLKRNRSVPSPSGGENPTQPILTETSMLPPPSKTIRRL